MNSGQVERAKYVRSVTQCYNVVVYSSVEIISVRFIVPIDINSIAFSKRQTFSARIYCYFENSGSERIIDALSLSSKCLFVQPFFF